MEWKIVHVDETDSTNRWLQCHGGSENMVVWADYQTAGRGCGTNTWESERAKNLLFSVLYHPSELPANRQWLISQAVSVAMCRVLEQYVSTVSIKWPNDIYVDERKIAGMLVENRLQGNTLRDSIIGIGLNVNQITFLGDAPNPVSLAQLQGHSTNREALLHELLTAIGYELQQVAEKHADTLYTNLLAASYKEHMFWRTGVHDFRETRTGREFMAAIVDVDANGHLLLESEEYGGGLVRHTYGFKEVEFDIGIADRLRQAILQARRNISQ